MTTIEIKMKNDTWEEHDLHFGAFDNNCSDCFSELQDCKFTDCRGNGKVEPESLVDTCGACTRYAESFDIGN